MLSTNTPSLAFSSTRQSRYLDPHPSLTVNPTETPLLVPLTSSLYVPATLNKSKPNTVLVDVGTGFYVEKSTADAIKFYNGKVEDLSKNLAEIEKAVGSKNESLRVVEDVLRQKVLAGEQGGQGGGSGSASGNGNGTGE